MADDLTLTSDPDAQQPLSGGIPLSDIPQTDFAPLEVTGIETLQGEPQKQRETAQEQFAREQMAAAGIEGPPAPPPGIDQFLFNEIVPPRAQMLPEVHDSRPPTEAEARRAANKITPLATDEEVALSQHTVKRFLESQQDDARAERIEWAQSYYTDEHKRKQLAQHPDMKLGIDLSPDPELFEQTSINNAWLNANAGRKLSAPELDVARKVTGKELFNIPDISNTQFFSKMQEWSKDQAAEKDLALKLDAAVGAHVLSDQVSRTYTPDYQVLEKLKKENPEVVTPENERQFALMNQRMHGRMRQLGEKVLEPYSQIFSLVQKTAQEKRDPTPAEMNAIVDSLSAIDPEDRKRMWGMVGRAGRAGIIDAKGLAQFTENMSKGWAREFNLSDRAERNGEMQLEGIRELMDSGAQLGIDNGRIIQRIGINKDRGRPLTPAERIDYRGKLDRAYNTIGLVREAQEAYETIVDPIRPIFKEGLLSAGERGLYALPAMGKLMIGGVVPGVGPALVFDAIQADIYRTTRLENPDMSAKAATQMAAVSAALQTIPEMVQIGLPLGKFGKLLETDRDLLASGFWAGAKTLTKKAVKGTAAEFMMENFQDAVDMFYPAIKSQFDPTMKRQDLGEVAWQYLVTRPEVFAAVLIPGSVAAGVHTYHDLKNPIRSLFNSDILRGMGIREDGIERILSKATFDEMQAQFRVEDAKVTPEDRARGHDYITATAVAAAVGQSAVQTPSYRIVTQKDGSKVYEVLDAEGKVVFSNTDEDLAHAAYVDTVTAFTNERLMAQQAAAASDEGQAATAEAEGALRVLEPESRTSAAYLLEFDDEQQPTPERAAAVARLEAALAADPRSGGQPVKLIAQTRRVGAATVSGQRLNETIDSLSRLFGKDIVFVRSATGEDLPFTGVVLSSDPNTIFLDAAGDRNVLALIGHEFSHTLELTNPTLHAAMVAQMRPLVFEWLNQEAKLRGEEGYSEKQVTDELVANIFGDALTRPEFLQLLNQRNPGLFERVVRAIEEFFNSLIAAARGSEWATEGFITDLDAMHGVIASTIEQARTAGPEVTAAPAEAELSFARRKHKFEERGKRETVAKGYITGKEKELIAKGVEAKLDKKGIAAGPERTRLARELNRQVQSDVLSHRMRYPDEGAKEPWSKSEPSGGMELEYKEAKGGEKPVVKAVARWKKQRYRFDEIPEGMTREEWARELAGKVTGQFIERIQKGLAADATQKAREGAELILREIEWYRDFVRKLRGEFGGFSDLMADFLGAFSPRQNVRQNWRNAIDAMWALSVGKYDELFERLDTFIKAGGTMKEWRAQGGEVMTSRNGALFGVNTDRGMEAALNLWREIKAGDSPKAKNFTRNLIGLSIKATIDVWAARLLNRVAGKPRIPIGPEGAVEGEHISEEEVKGQFAFGQEVFAHVAEMMRDPETWKGTGIDAAQFANVTPADVQAMNWFVEKEIWTEKNWTNEEGAGGSFMHEIGQMTGNRFVVGLSQQIERPGHEPYRPQNPEQARFANELLQELRTKYPNVIALRAMDSIGMFMSDLERSLDLEMVHGADMEPNDLIRTVLYHAWSKDQAATYISRVLDPDEEDQNENARPGLEVYFKEEVPRHVLDLVVEYLTSNGINGFTLVVDQRAKPDPRGGPDKFLGVRFQYIPEFSEDGENWAKAATDINDILINAIHLLRQMPGVAYSEIMRYDTLVLLKGIDYDDSGISPGTLGKSEAVAWRRRFFDATAARANRVAEAAPEPEHGEHVPDREQGQGPRGPPAEPGLSFATRREKAGRLAAREQIEETVRPQTVPISVFDRANKQFTTAQLAPNTELLRTLKVEEAIFTRLLECLR